MEDDRAPLAAEPQVQYFDVSDAESSDVEDGDGPQIMPHASRPGGDDDNDDDDDAQLEVFGPDEVEGGPRESGLGRAPHQHQQAAGALPPPVDPFGVRESRAAASVAKEDSLAAAKKRGAQAVSYFAGDGLAGGSSKVAGGASGNGGSSSDDEFDYAFAGEARQGETHKRVFDASAVPVPRGLLTDVRSSALGSFAEGEEEEEEEEEELEEEEVVEEGAEETSDGTGGEDSWAAANAKLEQDLMAAPPVRRAAPSAASEEGPADPPPQVLAASLQRPQWAAEPPASAPPPAAPAPSDPDFGLDFLAVGPRPGDEDAADDGGGGLELNDIDLFGDDAVAGAAADAAAKPAPGSRYSIAAPAGEWAEANRQLDNTAGPAKHTEAASQALTSAQALSYFASLDVEPYVGQIVEEEPSAQDGSSVSGIWGRILAVLTCRTGAARLRTDDLIDERRRLFCYAKMQFDNGDGEHERLLFSIYARFVGRAPPGGRFGSHWEDLGFQGTDPATDLRGCGMLGLLQLLHLWDADQGNARALFRLSQDPVQEFPLAVVGINVTKWCLQAMRAGKLNGPANRSGSVTAELNAFYTGTWYYFHQTWVARNATMRESGHVLKDVENYCKANVDKILKTYSSLSLEA